MHDVNMRSREGHSSMVEEISDDLQMKPDLIVVSVGGGGLALGVLRGTVICIRYVTLEQNFQTELCVAVRFGEVVLGGGALALH